MIQKKYNDFGIAIRITSRKVGNHERIMTPSDVINAHWDLADKVPEHQVAFSTNLRIVANKIKSIKKILFFNVEEDWYCTADIDNIISFNEPKIPSEMEVPTRFIPDGFVEPRRTWIILSNFCQINLDDINYILEDNKTYLNEIIKTPRFPRAYFKFSKD